jgi:hypothetical protein
MRASLLHVRPAQDAGELACDLCGSKPARFAPIKYGLTVEGINLCASCEALGFLPETPVQPPMSGPLTEFGWICPRCQRSNAPWVARCDCPVPTTPRSSDKEYADG